MPEVFENGDWFDLKAAEDISFDGPQAQTLHRKRGLNQQEKVRDVIFDYKLIPLGVVIQLPKGFEAIVCARSSTSSLSNPKKPGVVMANSIGVIDESYCGPNDQWMFPAIAFKKTTIKKGTRICQFRIQPTQKATRWQKLKWLLSSKVTFIEMSAVNNEDRGGLGEGTNTNEE